MVHAHDITYVGMDASNTQAHEIAFINHFYLFVYVPNMHFFTWMHADLHTRLKMQKQRNPANIRTSKHMHDTCISHTYMQITYTH
jgi:hypothetical protein